MFKQTRRKFMMSLISAYVWISHDSFHDKFERLFFCFVSNPFIVLHICILSRQYTVVVFILLSKTMCLSCNAFEGYQFLTSWFGKKNILKFNNLCCWNQKDKRFGWLQNKLSTISIYVLLIIWTFLSTNKNESNYFC